MRRDYRVGPGPNASKLNADFAKRIPQIAFDRIMIQFKINKDVQSINGWPAIVLRSREE